MLEISKTNLTPLAQNAVRRLATFANPDFYRAQAMRQPVYNKPRIIYCGVADGCRMHRDIRR